MENMQFDEYGQVKKESNLPIVEFYNDAIEDKAASAKQGRPIYRDIEMIKIAFPADRQRTLVRPANAEWKKIQGRKITYVERFSEQYKRFKADQPQIVEGTPLTEAPFLTVAQRAMLKGSNVYTVEQLASLDSQPLKNIGVGGRALQQAAQAYLDKASGTADVTRLADENAKLKALLEQMQRVQPPAPETAKTFGSEFDSMSDDDIKAFVKEHTGSAPRGNPSRETLVKMAAETAELLENT